MISKKYQLEYLNEALIFSNKLLYHLKVIELEPTNKAAINQIQICKQRIKEANDKERKIYANMFKKLSAADKEV